MFDSFIVIYSPNAKTYYRRGTSPYWQANQELATRFRNLEEVFRDCQFSARAESWQLAGAPVSALEFVQFSVAQKNRDNLHKAMMDGLTDYCKSAQDLRKELNDLESRRETVRQLLAKYQADDSDD